MLTLVVAVAPACSRPQTPRDWSTYDGPGAVHFRQTEYELPVADDPLEPLNRVFDAFNYVVLAWLIDPLSTGWRYLVPQSARTHLVMAADNIEYPRRGLNTLLQGQYAESWDETRRFLINTTVGVLGLFDPAMAWWNIRPTDTDTGTTFNTWGWNQSTYLVLPLGGPSTVRDGMGFIGDIFLDPATYFFPASPIKSFIVGSESVDDVKQHIETSFDAYTPARQLWLTGREIIDSTFTYDDSPSAAAETLSYAQLATRDPWFPYQRKTRLVDLDRTGEQLGYELWLQEDPSPTVFIVPGLGSHRQSSGVIALAEMVHGEGYNVVAISSSMNFDFINTAATVPVPGFPPADAADVHAALTAVDRDIELNYSGHSTRRILLGASLGAFHALFIAAAEDSDPGLVSFDRYVAINPPVRLRHAADQLDAMYNRPLAYPEAERNERVALTIQKAMKGGLGGKRATERPVFSAEEAEFLIGMSFRLALHDVIWASQLRHDMGVIGCELDLDRRAPATREILEFSYIEYFYAFVLPYFQAYDRAVDSADDMFSMADLHSIEQSLRSNDKIRVFTNSDEILMTEQDVVWLTDVLGDTHVKLHPVGGHLGNLTVDEVRSKIVSLIP